MPRDLAIYSFITTRAPATFCTSYNTYFFPSRLTMFPVRRCARAGKYFSIVRFFIVSIIFPVEKSSYLD